jgi:carboxyl-terminal processing protease
LRRTLNVWFVAALVGFAGNGSAAFAAPEKSEALDLAAQAELREKQGDWDRAYELYSAACKLLPNRSDLKDRQVNCLRHCWQQRRHRDLSYRKEVLSLDYGQSMRLFGMIRDALLDRTVDKKRLDSTKLFRKGLEELDAFVSDPTVLSQYIPLERMTRVEEYRSVLRKLNREVQGLDRHQLQHKAKEAAMAAKQILSLPPTVAMTEQAAGLCHALDEYTQYLSPAAFRELNDSLKGETVSVGLTVAPAGVKSLIVDIAPLSPASEIAPPIEPNDQLVSIDRKPVEGLSPDVVHDLLAGGAGSTVEIEILSPRLGMRTVTLRRRAVVMASVYAEIKPGNIGYLQIVCFQETTAQEVDETLSAFNKAEVKSVILDLRGNPGGVFDSAIETARRFLSTGVIVSTEHQDPRFNTVHQARNASAFTAPMIVLIDQDTASAAEVLAGALKENDRARIFGQPSFGKGCTQVLLKLPASQGVPTGGLRITIARFFSPKGMPYTGRGVLPDVTIERPRGMDMTDAPLSEALNELQRSAMVMGVGMMR